jgi:caffeoyl-CoA O-methyltransferase
VANPWIIGRGQFFVIVLFGARGPGQIGFDTASISSELSSPQGSWFCLALQKTNGHLTTFEIDYRRASLAQEHFREAGVEKMVTIIEGDAHEQVAKLKGPIDLVFIDADKSGYVDYLNKLVPLVQAGGLILAHNVDMVPDYVKAVTTRKDLETIFYTEGGGLGLTLKKRT